MKKKIAVIANGWNNLSVAQAIKGIRDCTDRLNYDIFLFLSFATFGQSKERVDGENAIFELTDYSDFDGVIVFSSMLNSSELPVKLCKKIAKTNPNVISVGEEVEGIDYIGIDNYKGMYEMVSHLIEKHHIKNAAFFAGPKVNEDSNERLEATKFALSDHGIDLPAESVFYTNWEYITSRNYVAELIENKKLPDAIICANDNIAIAVTIELQSQGFNVPNDVIVTGFDRISFADTIYPTITTVYQDYEKIGYISAWHLLEKIEENTLDNRIIVSSKFIENESCGCQSSSSADVIRRKFCTDSYAHEMENLVFQGHNTDIANVLFNCSNFNSFEKNINEFYSKDHSYESNNFYFVIDSNTMKVFKNSSFGIAKQYSQKMHSVVAINDGKIEKYEDFDRNQIIPEYKKKKNPQVYTICSLHYDASLFGYLVMGDAIEHMKDTTLNHYVMQLNNNLEKYRQNNYLDEMNRALQNIANTDQLTGLLNRTGMQNIAVPLYENAKKENKQCAIVFADINRMKHINDNFGHLQGDLAIRTVSSAMMSNLPEKWISIRYGGDEFIALGVCNNEKQVTDFIAKMNKHLEDNVATMQLSYPLTISSGYIMTENKENLTLIEYINKADSIMYIHKQQTYRDENKDHAGKPLNQHDIEEIEKL